VALLLLGCQTGLPEPRVRLDDEGVVYLYLQPLPRDAARLRATLEGIGALHVQRGEVPLALALRELTRQDVSRQRLLAAGPLPDGEYSGFVVRMGKASLGGPEGQSALLGPEAPVRIDYRFSVRRGEGSVVALALDYARSVEAGFRWTPVFSVYPPERPAPGLMGFVANSRSNDVSVFDKRSAQVFDVIATGRGPAGLALDQRGRKVYVALAGDDGVEVIDVLAGRITERIRLTPGDEPVALALTPDGSTLLSANRGSNTVSLIDPVSRFERRKIDVGSGPRFIVLDRAGRRAFVFNELSNSVSVLGLPSGVALGAIATDPGPVQGRLNRRGDRLYVVHVGAAYVTVIDPNTLRVTGRFAVRTGMDAVQVDPNTDFVFLASRRELAVGVYDPFSFAAVDFIDTGAGIVQMATDGEENTVYLVSPDLGRVLVFDRIRKRTVGELDVGEGASWIGVMGEN